MVRFFGSRITLLCLSLIVALVVAGCAALQSRIDAWKQAHPTTQIIDRAAAVGGAAIESAVKGSPMPLFDSIREFVGWLIAGGGAVTAVVKRNQAKRLAADNAEILEAAQAQEALIEKLTAPWNGQDRRARYAGQDRRRPRPSFTLPESSVALLADGASA